MKRNSMVAVVAVMLVVSIATAYAKMDDQGAHSRRPRGQSTVAVAATRGTAVGFARVRISDGTVVSFGGRGTTSVVVDVFDSASISLRFIGTYPGDIALHNVVAQATAQATVQAAAPDRIFSDYGVANVLVDAASPTEIGVDILHWKSSDQSDLAGTVFVTLMIGA